jgi:hypothetical protein
MKKLTTLFLLLLCVAVNAQSNATSYESLDSIVTNLYSSISGDKTKERDWEHFKNLFHKDARVIYYDGKKDTLISVTPKEYATKISEYLKTNNFYEREIFRKVDTYGPITQVFSTYESSVSDDKKVKPFEKGINSIQLLNDGRRWWVISIYWSRGTTETPIPKAYLPK